MEKPEQGLEYLMKSLDIGMNIYGKDSLQVSSTYELLTRVYHQQNQFKKALASQRNAFMIFKSTLGEEQEQTKSSVSIMKTLTAKAVEAAKLK